MDRRRLWKGRRCHGVTVVVIEKISHDCVTWWIAKFSVEQSNASTWPCRFFHDHLYVQWFDQLVFIYFCLPFGFSEEVLKHGNSVEILVIKKQLCERMNALISSKFQGEPEENDIIYFVANQDGVVKAIEGLGQIKTSNAFPAQCTVTDDMKSTLKGRKSKFTVETR